jgi:hypothetical protein
VFPRSSLFSLVALHVSPSHSKVISNVMKIDKLVPETEDQQLHG